MRPPRPFPTFIDVGALLTCAACLLSPGAALADKLKAPATEAPAPASANETNARAAFADGLRLRDQEHNPRAALESFKVAYRLATTTRTAYELGKTYFVLGQLVEAQKLFVEVDHMPPDPLQTPEGKAARDDAKQKLAELEMSIPTITIKTTGLAPGDAPPRFTLDGEELSAERASHPIKLNPGTHTVTAKRGWHEKTHTVLLKQGFAEEVSFDFTPSDPALTRKAIALGVGAAGALVLLAGGVYALGAISAKSESSSHCGAAVGGANDNQCDASGVSSRQSAGSKADTATVLFLVGGAAVGAGVVLWVTAPKTKEATPQPSVSLGVAPTGLLLRGGF